MFNDIKVDSSVQTSGDKLGGSVLLESGVYDFTIKLAYGTLSKGKATALNLLLETADHIEIKQQLWVTSGEAKGRLPYYIDKRTKTKKFLPGYELANDLCMMTINKPLNQTVSEDKTIMLYDYSQGKEVPTQVKMLTELIGKKIFGGVIKQVVDKNILDSTTNTYVPSGEIREENEIDKFFHHPTGLTVTEATAKVAEPKFKNDWVKKWAEVTRDKTTKLDVLPGAPAGKSNPTTTSLFG